MNQEQVAAAKKKSLKLGISDALPPKKCPYEKSEAELVGLIIGWAKEHKLPTPWAIHIKYREPGQPWIIEDEDN